eukprot:TRINITY_DN8502_c0_g2_i1.p1 TRINITY_DN8502_c0_g2~~TRINITY_DN8502_c0_g2_i1.p1  ORF type:complete len:214 (+),score=40.66 TRINITY_DN8502_c0_g2_i1:170-811(+)
MCLLSLGVEDNSQKGKKVVFLKKVCHVSDTVIKFDCNDIRYEIYSVDGSVFIWNPEAFGSQCQLFFRCPNSNTSPLEISEILAYNEPNSRESLLFRFKATSKGEVIATTVHSSENTEQPSPCYVEVLCRRLLIMHTADNQPRQTTNALINYLGTQPLTTTNTTTTATTNNNTTSTTNFNKSWLLYLHSDLAFFSFGHPLLPFGAPLHRTLKKG